MDDSHKWWWPNNGFWPPSAKKEVSVSAFMQAFSTRGFEPCSDGSLEEGYEKVVLYVDDKNTPTHSAKQIAQDKFRGYWSSKLGESIDICHKVPEALSGPSYGIPEYFFKRDLRAYQQVLQEVKAERQIAERKRRATDKKQRYENRKRKRKTK
jgi:hypothetical protein